MKNYFIHILALAAIGIGFVMLHESVCVNQLAESNSQFRLSHYGEDK